MGISGMPEIDHFKFRLPDFKHLHWTDRKTEKIRIVISALRAFLYKYDCGTEIAELKV